MRLNVRSSLITLGLIAIGAGIGGLGTAAGIRASRNPNSWLHALRYGSRPATHPASSATPTEPSETAKLERVYGPDRQSQGYEEWIVRDFFRDRRNGVFVDVGAADYKDGSNTWFLENRLGWSGLAIDAQEHYQTGYEQFRPRTRFFTFFVSDKSNEKARLFLSNMSSFVASKDERFTAQFGQAGEAIEIPTITLNDLLDAQGVKSFDFLTMDIELSEPQGLAGLEIQRFKPQLVVVEAHPNVRQQILDYFNANHYVVVGKYLRVDVNNLWFMPEGSSVEDLPGEDKQEDGPR